MSLCKANLHIASMVKVIVQPFKVPICTGKSFIRGLCEIPENYIHVSL